MKSTCTRASGARRGGLLGLLAFALMIPHFAFAADTPITYVTSASIIDTWVKSGINTSNDNTQLSIGDGREIYLRVRVNAATVGSGMPITATLTLKQKNGVNGVSIELYAANNRKTAGGQDWLEPMVWGDQPLATTLLDTQTARTSTEMGAGTNTVDFPLVSYISGPGDYTFCVKTASATQVNFYSSETSASNGPKLVVLTNQGADDTTDWESEYFRRDPSEMEIIGAEYRDRYKASSTGADGIAAAKEVDNVGYIDVTRQPYGAKTDGTDATLAIQRAVNEARAARRAVYFPPGNYTISDTIQLVQGENPNEYINADVRWNGREFPNVLLGNRNTSLARTKLTLAPSSPGFNDTSTPLAAKPMLHFWSRIGSRNRNAADPDDDGVDPRDNKANSQYNQILDNIDLDLNGANGNSGAIGIDMDAAQGSNISNSRITATSAFAGLYGGTGPGGYTYGVTVVNGSYGGYFADAHCPLIINSKFTGQTTNSLYHSGRGPLTLVGCEINGRGIKAESLKNNPWQANLNVVDSRIQITGLAVESNRSVALTNVYLFNGAANTPIVQVTDPVTDANDTTYTYTIPGGHAGWKRIIRLARGVNTDQSVFETPPSPTATRVRYWTDGTPPATGWHIVEGPNGAPPTTYLAGVDTNLHAWIQTPDFNDPNVINAKTSTIAGALNQLKGDGSDDAPRLQAIINTANPTGRPIFIPVGEYTLNSTVNLAANSTVFGIGSAFSIFRPKVNFAETTALLQSPDDPAATTMLADLKLLLPMNTTVDLVTGKVTLLKWRSGAASTVKNIDFDRRLSAANNKELAVPVIHIFGANAGGKWYGPRVIASVNFSPAGDARYLKVENTGANAQKLRFYMLNIEHCDSSPQIEFTNASNFDIYQLKAESRNYNGKQDELIPGVFSTEETIWFTSCTNFRVLGLGGSASPGSGLTNANIRISNNSTNYLFTQIQFQQQDPDGPDNLGNLDDGQGYYPADFRRLIWDGGPVGSTVRGDEQAVLYLKGTPPDQAN